MLNAKAGAPRGTPALSERSGGFCGVPLVAGTGAEHASGLLNLSNQGDFEGTGVATASTQNGEALLMTQIQGMGVGPIRPSTGEMGACAEATLTIDDIVITGPDSTVMTQYFVQLTAIYVDQIVDPCCAFPGGAGQCNLIFPFSRGTVHIFLGNESTVLTSGMGNVEVGVPFSIEVYLFSSAELQVFNTIATAGEGSVSYNVQARFRANDVFDLPPGYTANSADGKILDNQYMPEATHTPTTIAKPTTLQLGVAFPNPLRHVASIEFGLTERARVTLRVIDVSGRVVRVLREGTFGAGQHTAEWNGRDDRGFEVGSGVYFYELVGVGSRDTRKVVVQR